MKRVLFLTLVLLVLFTANAHAADQPILRPTTPLFGPAPGAGVQVVGAHHSYLYVVQGAPQPIKGIGYNAPLSAL